MRAGSRRHLVIVGGGHAHVAVLKSLALLPEPAAHVTVVSPGPYATYTGMVPGVLAGQYDPAEAQIDVEALAARANARFTADRVVRLDRERRVLDLADRASLTYDIVSFDIGSRPLAADRVADDAPVVMVKPIERAWREIETALRLVPSGGGHQAVVVGGGAGGIEIAFALAARLRDTGTVTLCGRDRLPLLRRGNRVARVVMGALERKRIRFLGDSEVVRADRDHIRLTSGESLPCTLIIWATGAAAPPLLAASGLATDARGFVIVTDELASRANPDIFAAGDCATLHSHPDLPKAGVYAVRAGPVLAHNLRRAAQGGGRTQVFQPQRHVLSLLNTADGSAILDYRGFAIAGTWVWRLKDRIDRAFVRQYAPPRELAA